MARQLIMAENRMKMHAKETPWGKYLRLNELARHRARCRQMKPSIDASPPRQSPQQIMNRERSDLEQGMGLRLVIRNIKALQLECQISIFLSFILGSIQF